MVICYYTLEKPLQHAYIVMLAALLPSFIAFFMLSGSFVWQVFWQVFCYLVVIFTLSLILRFKRSWSSVLQAAGLIGPFLVFLIYTLYPDIDAWWLERLTSYMQNTDIEQGDLNLVAYSKYATGMQTTMLVVSAMFNLLLARVWQAAIYNKIKKVRQECYSVTVSGFSSITTLVLALCFYANFNWGLDAFIVSLIPAFFVGISLFHCWHMKNIAKSNRTFALIAFYMVILVMFPFAPIILVCLGFLDVLLDLRSRYSILYK
jgi:hypothetical protein